MRNKPWIFAFCLLAACGDGGGKKPGIPGPVLPGDDAGMDAGPLSSDGGADPTDSGSANEQDAGAVDSSTPDRADAGDALDSGAGEDASVWDAGADAGQEVEPDASADAGNDSEPDAGGEEDAGPELTEDEKLAKAYEQKLRDCDVIGEGPHNPGDVEDELDRCVAGCTIAAECADLKGSICETGDPQDSDFGACAGACFGLFLDNVGEYPADGFECQTGHRIPHATVCDDGEVLNCPLFGEDEVDCPKFLCKSGSPRQISTRYVCDGKTGAANGGCSDGSDEEECAPLLCD